MKHLSSIKFLTKIDISCGYFNDINIKFVLLLMDLLTFFSTSAKAIWGDSSPWPGLIPRSISLPYFLYSLVK